MSISQNAAAAREAARQKTGEFGHQQHTESGVSLSPASDQPPIPAQAQLTEALDRLNLSTDDVPGLEQAWAEHFEGLNASPEMDEAEFASMVLGEINIGRHRGGPWLQQISKADELDLDETRTLNPETFDPSEHVALIEYSTRNGAGNRECWNPEDCEGGCTGCVMESLQEHELHFTDQDDSFDPTYASIAFRIPEEHLDTAFRVASADERNRKRKSLQSQANEIAQGAIAPWSVMADRQSMDPNALPRLNQSLVNLQSAVEREQAEVSKFQGYLDWLDGNADEPEGNDDRLAPVYVGRQDGYKLTGVFRHTARDAVKQLSEARSQMADQQETMDQAQALPEGKLRSWLLDDRPERSYQTTEPVGRNRTKMVTRTYTPKGKLQEAYDDAQDDLDRATQRVSRVRDDVAEHHRYHSDRAAKNRTELQELLSRREHVWTQGWPGKVEDCPMPDWDSLETDDPW